MMILLAPIALFLIGLCGLLMHKNLIKMIISVVIMENSVNLLLVLIGYGSYGVSDPMPEAAVLSVVVIELATVILMAALALKIYRKYGTLDITNINRLKG